MELKDSIKTGMLALGGAPRIKLMTGAERILVDNDQETFSVFKYKGSRHSNIFKVTYDAGADLFNVKFLKVRGFNLKEVETLEGVYVDQLKEIFESKTGLYLSF